MTIDWMLWPVMTAWAWPFSWAVVAAACVWWLWPREAQPHPARAAPVMWATSPSLAQSKLKGPPWLTAFTAGMVACLAVWPHGGWSGYAALALQSPSLVTLTWAVVCGCQAARWIAPASDHSRVPAMAWYVLCALGWLLTIDTLNLWPDTWNISFYAWGFSASCLWLSAVLVLTLAWRCPGDWVWPCVGLLAFYACLRWPSGNLWDAWLDPAVWIVAHVHMARHIRQTLSR